MSHKTLRRHPSKILFSKTPVNVLLTGVFLLVCIPAASAQPAKTTVPAQSYACDAIVSVLPAEPSNLIPFLATDSVSADVSRLIFNGLVKYDPDLKLAPDLAQSWEVLDGGLTIRFHLRHDVHWQDGVPFDAQDVVFTYDKLTDPNVPTPYGADFDKVLSVQAPDPFTVVVRYREPFSPGLASWCMGIVPKHLLVKENLRTTGFARLPIGTGPYRMAKWISGQKIELEANREYFEGAPKIDRCVFRILPDQTTAFLELSAEGVDLTALTPLQYQKLTGGRFFQEKYRKYKVPSFGYVFLGYNLRHPLFASRQVRRALGIAIDRKEIIQMALLGCGRPAAGPFLEGSWAADPSIKAASFEPSGALALLKKEGWVRGKDGRLSKNGQYFTFTVLTTQGNDQRTMALELIQRRLADIGVEMKIRTLEWSVFLKEFVDPGRFEAVLLGWRLSVDPDCYSIFHSTMTGPGKFNFVGYSNSQVDRWLDEGRRQFDPAARARIYHQIQRQIREDEPYSFLYVSDSMPIVHKRFNGVKESPIGIGYNLNEWWVEPAQARYRSACAAKAVS
ncbi:MAG: peptide-binding protein [Candidatus Omnitrophota bacterium]